MHTVFQQRAQCDALSPAYTQATKNNLFFRVLLTIPYPVRRGRWDVDSKRPPALLHLHSEQDGRVRHLLHLLLDKLCLGCLLKVLGLGDLVHKAHDLAWSVASYIATRAEDGNSEGGGGEKE